MVPQSGSPVSRGSRVLSDPPHRPSLSLLLFHSFLFMPPPFLIFHIFSFSLVSYKSTMVSLFHCLLFLSFYFRLDWWCLEGLWCTTTEDILNCSHVAKPLLHLATLSFSYSVSCPCHFLFIHSSGMALAKTMLFCQIVSRFTTLVQVELAP